MSRLVIFTTAAENDLSDIQDYYNKISTSITDNFFKEFFTTFDFIEQEPQYFKNGIEIFASRQCNVFLMAFTTKKPVHK